MLKSEQYAPTAVNTNAMDAGKLDPMIIRNFVRTGTLAETDAFTDEYITSLDGVENAMLFRYYLLVSIRVNAELELRDEGVELPEIAVSLPAVDVNIGADDVRGYLKEILGNAIKLRDVEAQKRSSDIIDSALKYIDRNYTDENISLDSVAVASNISANYLSALFSQKVGLSFVEYITKKRMARARQLLRNTSKRSGEIAVDIGYKDPRYFSFVFKKKHGCTPSQYRNGESDEE